MAVWRTWLTGLAAVTVWLLSVYAQTPPAALGTDAPATQFSAMRARAVLTRLQDPIKPHPAGSAENGAVHVRLRAELAALGVAVTAQSRMSCYNGRRWNAIVCARITNLIGEVVPGGGKAIVMMAHMDSVPAGPGAGDDGSGVAAILETIRALNARGLQNDKHPILAVFTDGEEYGLLGAAALVHDPAWRGRIGIVINMEGRGSNGRSLLFQTSPGNGRLIDLYAHNVPRYASSSLNSEVYRFLPNDTDLTPVLQAGLTGYNFAFIGDVADYHTPNDTVANLDPRTLQSHGDNLLGLTTALEETDFAGLKGGEDAYLDVFGLWLPRLASAWMLPLSILVFAVIAVTGWQRRPRGATWLRLAGAGLMPLVLLLGCIAIGFALHFIASTISGAPDPSFAHPWALRLALAMGVWGIALLAGALGAGATACWLWLAGLGIVTAALMPGLSPFFVFPALVAAAALPFAGRHRFIALSLPALSGLIVWLGLLVQGEEILGLMMHPLFTVTAAFALIALVPLLPRLNEGERLASAAAAGMLTLGSVFIAGFLPPYSAAQPQRLNLHYIEQNGAASLAADPVRPCPRVLCAGLSRVPRVFPGLGSFYAASLGKARFPAPSADVSRDGSQVHFRIHGSSAADGMSLVVPKEAKLASAVIEGRKFVVNSPGRFTISCLTAECGDIGIVLDLKSVSPVTVTLTEQRLGLPPEAAELIAKRGATAVPSQFGDSTLLAADVTIPRR